MHNNIILEGSTAHPARFSPADWNYHRPVLEDQACTTCAAEAYNHGMNSDITSRPFFGTFVQGIQRKINAADKQEIDIMKGQGRKRHTKTVTRDAAIFKAVTMYYTNITIIDFLTACAVVLMYYK